MSSLLTRLKALVSTAMRALATRSELVAENLALRQQLAVLRARTPRPEVRTVDRLFWVALARVWPKWKEALHFVKPETVIAWHRRGFRLFWSWRARGGGRPLLAPEVRALIQRLATDNAGWGAPRIHGELLKLGFTVAQSTVAAWMPKRPRPEKPRSQRWRTFLKNHLAQAVAMDFFVIPTATFQLLYGFVVLQHNRRRIRHVAVTAHPTAEWTAQQLREAFPCDSAPRFLHRDRDGIYGDAVTTTIEAMGIEEVLSAPRSPWQNPYCERVIGTLRRELLNNVIVLGESHARRLLKENVEYCNGSRTHLSLEKDAPEPRAIEPPSAGPVQAREGLGGLHHPLLPPRGVVGLSQLEVRPPRSTCVLGASRANSTSSSAWRSSRTRRASYSALPVTGRTHRDGDVRTLLRTADRQVAFEVFGRHNGDRRTRTAVQVAQVMNRA